MMHSYVGIYSSMYIFFAARITVTQKANYDDLLISYIDEYIRYLYILVFIYIPTMHIYVGIYSSMYIFFATHTTVTQKANYDNLLISPYQ